MIKLVIFDLDGTLVNAYPAVSKSVNYTLKALGVATRSHAEIKRSVGEGDRRLMATFVAVFIGLVTMTVGRFVSADVPVVKLQT